MVSVDVNDKNCIDKLAEGLKPLINGRKVVILCIGTEKVIGDSLGPATGTRLVNSLTSDVIVYGMLDSNVNAKNLLLVKDMIKTLHSDRVLVAIDAALGLNSEIGTMQIYAHGLYPGSATNKNLPCIGDVSIVGIVNQKICAFELSMLYTAKYKMVNDMAHAICQSILNCIN